MKLVPKGSNKLVKVGKSIEITNKLITEIDSREVAISDDFRVHIPDFNFQKVLIRNFCIVFDSAYEKYTTVAYGDIKDITQIDCEGEEIESLKGIECFTALTSLICGYNQLTSLDITKNTALTRLWCGDNQLTNLDLSNNTLLKSIWLEGNPETWWKELEKDEE